MINKSKIAIFSCARTTSERCKKKMIRSFDSTTLSDIIIKKLSLLNYNVYFAGYEKIFKTKSSFHNVNFIQRSKTSSLSEGPNSKIHEYLFDLEYDYFLLINACLPFLKLQTINNFIDFCLKSNFPKTIITKKKITYLMIK